MNIKNQVDGLVAEGGWLVMGVGGSETEPGFCYTIGLHSLGLPEVIIMGLPPTNGQTLLNDVGFMMKEQGGPVEFGKSYDEFANLPTQFVEVDEQYIKEYMCQAGFYYGESTPLKAIQMVWPDTQGKFPWDMEFEERFRAVQPILTRFKE